MNTDNDFAGSVCTDCLMAIANGDTSGIDDVATWEIDVAQRNSTDNGRYNVVPMSDGEPYFSSCMCDYCGTRLAGDRHDVVYLDNQA